MKNLLPDTMAVRAMVLLVIGLAFTHLVSNIFYATDRDNALLTAGGRHAIQWVATAGALSENLPASEWPKIIETAQTGSMFATITDEPVVRQADATSWHSATLKMELDRHVGQEQASKYTISYAKSGAGTEAMAYWQAYLSRAGMDMPPEMVLVSRSLGNGSWINAAAAIQSPPRFFSMQLGFSMVVMLISVIAISWLIVRRMTEPLKNLSRAAEQLGTDVRAPAIPETGPEEVRRTAQAFNVMQGRIRRFVEDRTQMLAAIAHDLGTPVTRLRLRAEFVEDQELRAKILRDLDDMQNMVSSALAFIREDALGEPQDTVEIGSLLARVCDDILDTGADVQLAEIPRWVSLECRPAALRRAVGNLVENAVKYGGFARVSMQLEPETIVIRVDDDGPGIPEASFEDAFQPFRRLDASRNFEKSGTGLGLSVARTIVRAHGGDISLQNLINGGLRAEMRLPRLIQDATTDQPNETEMAGNESQSAKINDQVLAVERHVTNQNTQPGCT